MKKLKNQINSIASTQKLFIGLTSVMSFLFAFNIARAQHNVNITFRPGANFPVKDLGETKLSRGGGFEATVAYEFITHLQAYAGWGWNTFNTESTADSKLLFVETGYTLGFHFIHPFTSTSKLRFMIGGSGIYNHIETENKEGDIVYDTGHGPGWQAEAGLAIPIGHHNRWQLLPNVRYHTLSRDETSKETQTTVDLNYFSIGLGVTWILWKAE